MINTYTRSYQATGDEVNVLECKIYYNKGGVNWGTGRNEPRGYYFSIQPYLINGMWKSFKGFSGSKTCILECQRQSKKRYLEAKSMMDNCIEKYMNNFCTSANITVDMSEYEETETETRV